MVIFQRGGNDGLNTFVPFNTGAYYDFRKTLFVAEPSSNPDSAIALTSGTPMLDGTEFGLNPNMASLVPLWNAGDMAIMPATHVGINASRSHFAAQDFIEFGHHMSLSSTVAKTHQGWLNRWMGSRSLTTNTNGLELFGFVNARAIRDGSYPITVLTNPSAISLGGSATLTTPWMVDLRERLQAGSGIANSTLGQAWANQQERTYSAIDKFSQVGQYAAENGAMYPASRLGGQLRQTAALLRSVGEIEVVTIDTGGYDTHSDQAVLHPLLLRDISDSLAAFHADMGEDMNNVAVLVMTEFGRTLDQNETGTDHGWASAWWVISKGITGGFYGGWPGLDSDNIGFNGGRPMLNYDTDYRQILADLLVNFMPGSVANAEAAFPGFTYGAPLGFV